MSAYEERVSACVGRVGTCEKRASAGVERVRAYHIKHANAGAERVSELECLGDANA